MIKVDFDIEALLSAIKVMINDLLDDRFKNVSNDQILSAKEVQEMLGISHVTLSKHVKNQLIPEHRLGGGRYFKQTEIMEALGKVKRYKTK